jgi:hypothetical protein
MRSQFANRATPGDAGGRHDVDWRQGIWAGAHQVRLGTGYRSLQNLIGKIGLILRGTTP